MPARSAAPPDPQIVSLLSFWSEAGVDCIYADAPQNRLKPPPGPSATAKGQPPKAAPRAPATPTPVGASDAAAPDAAAFDAQALNAQALSAQALADAAPDLPALEAAIAAFDGCPLKTQGASRAVFSRGRADAPVMIIGEAPGADEDRQGQPFVGRAGKLLDRMLAAAGLEDQVFITNTVFWRPPGNRTPTTAEQRTCRPFVERAIALVRPQVLVLAGGASAKAMLDTTQGILSLRGRWTDWTSADGATALPALPTLHPAFLLRQPLSKKSAWADLLTLTAKLDRLRGDA